jgi:Protein of unknown function (DUF4013)
MTTPSPPPGAPAANFDFGRSFTFTAEDPEWLNKVLIGGAFVLACSLLVGVPFVLGYFSRTLRNVAKGAARPLPTWDDLGGLFEEGLRLTAVYLIHLVGVFIVLGLLFSVLLLPVILSGAEDASDALGPLGALLIVALYGLLMLVSLATAAYVPAALVRSALAGTIGAGLEWRENLAFIKANLANYALSLVSYLVAGFLAQFGVLLCCVGVFPALFWSYLVLAMSLGQTVRLAGTPAAAS